MSKASQKAYKIIRAMIVDGEFVPGKHLKEEELAAVCDVSRTPIRDALRTLASEDFVKVVPNHGTFVSEYSSDDIEDIFQMRALLEGYAAKCAALRATEETIDELEQCCAQIEKKIAADGLVDPDAYLDHNREFHFLVWEAAGNDRLGVMASRLVQQPVLYRTARSYDREDFARSIEHHQELVQAIKSGSGDWAQSIMATHIFAGYETFKHWRAQAKEATALLVESAD